MRVYYDQFTQCVCGHHFGSHARRLYDDDPHQCLLCECEAFMTEKQAKAFAEEAGR